MIGFRHKNSEKHFIIKVLVLKNKVIIKNIMQLKLFVAIFNFYQFLEFLPIETLRVRTIFVKNMMEEDGHDLRIVEGIVLFVNLTT